MLIRQAKTASLLPCEVERADRLTHGTDVPINSNGTRYMTSWGRTLLTVQCHVALNKAVVSNRNMEIEPPFQHSLKPVVRNRHMEIKVRPLVGFLAAERPRQPRGLYTLVGHEERRDGAKDLVPTRSVVMHVHVAVYSRISHYGVSKTAVFETVRGGSEGEPTDVAKHVS